MWFNITKNIAGVFVMNIAIVDDDKIELDTIETLLHFGIKKFRANCKTKINIEKFLCADEFLSVFSPRIYQTVVLGLNMRRLAKFISDSGVKIIFINSEENCL